MAYPYLSDILRAAFGINLPLPLPTFGLLVGAAFFTGLHFANREAKRLVPEQPADFMGTVCITAFITGLLGARLFHILEHPVEFLAHPGDMLLSRAGFTIFGGLIVGTICGLVYCRAKRAPFGPVLDAIAPAVMLAYAIGRIGCQISGDGDWGIPADLAAKPTWLPLWLWAQTYTGNIAGVDIPPPGVYPTPIYETVMSLIAFGLLWSLRRHRHRAGWLFGLYILLAGIERLLIESIRVNTAYEIFGRSITQAQIIASLCLVGGVAVMIWRRGAPKPP